MLTTSKVVLLHVEHQDLTDIKKKTSLCFQAGPIQNVANYWSFLHMSCQSTEAQQCNSEPLGSSDFLRNCLLF